MMVVGLLSPLLSNVMLDDLDWELERRGDQAVRYADDGRIYVRSERAGQRVMERITKKGRGGLRPWKTRPLGSRLPLPVRANRRSTLPRGSWQAWGSGSAIRRAEGVEDDTVRGLTAYRSRRTMAACGSRDRKPVWRLCGR
jgi:hypothetical protein